MRTQSSLKFETDDAAASRFTSKAKSSMTISVPGASDIAGHNEIKGAASHTKGDRPLPQAHGQRVEGRPSGDSFLQAASDRYPAIKLRVIV